MNLLREFYKWLKLRNEEMLLNSFAVGMNSSVDLQQNLHIVVLDYDIKNIFKLRESIKELQSFWNLSDADIFRTRNGHHVFFWYDQIPYERLKLIIDFAKYVDPMYKYISKYYNHKTIRVAGKYKMKDIHYVETIKGKRFYSDHEKTIGDLKKQEHNLLTNMQP